MVQVVKMMVKMMDGEDGEAYEDDVENDGW